MAFTLNKTSGSGNDTIQVTADKNTASPQQRVLTITTKSGQVKKVTLFQDAASTTPSGNTKTITVAWNFYNNTNTSVFGYLILNHEYPTINITTLSAIRRITLSDVSSSDKLDLGLSGFRIFVPDANNNLNLIIKVIEVGDIEHAFTVSGVKFNNNNNPYYEFSLPLFSTTILVQKVRDIILTLQ